MISALQSKVYLPSVGISFTESQKLIKLPDNIICVFKQNSFSELLFYEIYALLRMD